MNLIEMLKKDYGINNPIILKELNYDLSNDALRMRMKRLTDQGKLRRYSDGIYYIPEESIIGELKLNSDVLIRNKYISDGESIFGFYTGLKMLNTLGLTTQVPNTVEIMTNSITSRKTKKRIGKREIILIPSVTPITEDNINILKLIELIKYPQFRLQPIDVKKRVLEEMGIDKESILKIRKLAGVLPPKVSQSILASEVLYAIAS